MTIIIQPKSYFTAAGKPFHQLLDTLIEQEIPVYTEELEYDPYPGTLIELSYDEHTPNGDTLQHTFTLSLGEVFIPMRQVTFFNNKRYLVLEPSFQEVQPGIHFPIEGSKIRYNIQSEKNELQSITTIAIQSIRINTDIPADTFTFHPKDTDQVTDLRPGNQLPKRQSSQDIPLG